MTIPAIDLTIHSNDSPYWELTMHTSAARVWASKILGVSLDRANPSFETDQDDAVIASAREAGLMLSFSASHTATQFGVA